MLRLRNIVSSALVFLSFFLLYVAMTGRPGGPDMPALAYVGLWVGAAVAIIGAYWLAKAPSKGDV